MIFIITDNDQISMTLNKPEFRWNLDVYFYFYSVSLYQDGEEMEAFQLMSKVLDRLNLRKKNKLECYVRLIY